MNKELLKRVIAECSDEGSRSNISTDLYCAITEYLEMPEPEPVAWMWENGLEVYFENSGDPDHNWVPLYTATPDQSAQIAELEKDNDIVHENLAWYMKKYHEHLTIIAELEKEVFELIGTNSKLAPSWGMQASKISQLEQQLAALQAKREPLSSDQVGEVYRTAFPKGQYVYTNDAFVFARMIEKAHGIG